MPEAPVVLLPAGSQWDARRRRSRYEGSSLRAIDGRLEWTGPRGGPTDWCLEIGRGPGQAAKLTRVLASLNDATGPTTSTRLDRYAVLGADGVMLAWFPATVDVRPFPDALAWFPEPAVERFANRAGLEFGRVTFDTARELGQRFPGLYKRTPLFVASEYAMSIVMISAGFGIFLLALLGGGAWSDVGAFLVRVFVCVCALAIGGLGILMFPDVYRRIPRRDDPSRADPSNGSAREN